MLQTIKWGVYAWTYEVFQVFIANCWLKSRVIAPKMGSYSRHEDQGELYRSEIRDEAQRIAARDKSQISEEAQRLKITEREIEYTLQYL